MTTSSLLFLAILLLALLFFLLSCTVTPSRHVDFPILGKAPVQVEDLFPIEWGDDLYEEVVDYSVESEIFGQP